LSKGPQAFRTISEAAEELGVPQHVLRFWETRFSFIRPMKRAGGRRFYRPQDIAVLAGVQALLHRDGLSIKAVQALHRDEGIRRVLAAAAPPISSPPALVEAPGAALQTIITFTPEPEPAAEPDLFADSPRPSIPAPTPAALPGSGLPRPRLNSVGRVRLTETLAGLEALKARLDGLLGPH
jgi:DNA-binding transcriptional MerR regulator